MDYPDPENSLQLLYSANKTPGPNVTSFQNSDFDKKFLAYKATDKMASKHKLLREIETLVIEWSTMKDYYVEQESRIKLAKEAHSEAEEGKFSAMMMREKGKKNGIIQKCKEKLKGFMFGKLIEDRDWRRMVKDEAKRLKTKIPRYQEVKGINKEHVRALVVT